MLPVALVPNGRNIYSSFFGEQNRTKLCLPLVSETVSYAERIFPNYHLFTRLWGIGKSSDNHAPVCQFLNHATFNLLTRNQQPLTL
jgi:hypothetical protein